MHFMISDDIKNPIVPELLSFLSLSLSLIFFFKKKHFSSKILSRCEFSKVASSVLVISSLDVYLSPE